MSPQHLDPTITNQELTDHPYYAYRGCAPDTDDPALAAGNLELSVQAWQAPDRDGGEEQDERVAREAAAKAVCSRCPVLAQCRAFGASVVVDGDVAKLAEQFAILGGMTALERHKAFIKTRHEVAVPAPDRKLRTPQKLAVLRALAQFTDPDQVAAAAGMDVARANWQRTRIATLLNLPVGASRADLLAEAGRRGLLEGVALPNRMDGPCKPGKPRSPRRSRFTAVAGQLEFDDLFPDDLAPTAPVTQLPVHTVLLEAAA